MPKLVAMSPSRSRWGWPPALALLGTILDFARLDSNPADRSGEARSSSGPTRGSRVSPALAALIDRRSACSAAAVPDLVSRTCAEARSSISNEPASPGVPLYRRRDEGSVNGTAAVQHLPHACA